jgi:hypothetical protein
MDVREVCELIPRSLCDITTAKQTSCQFSRNYRQGFGFGNSCRSPPGAAYNESQCLIKIRMCWCFGLLGGIVHDFLQAASSVRNRGRSSCSGRNGRQRKILSGRIFNQICTCHDSCESEKFVRVPERVFSISSIYRTVLLHEFPDAA